MSAGWYVVKFKNEKNIIEVIPSNWIKNFEACFWPLKFGSIKLQSAIKNRANPEKDWKLYPIKVICNKMFTVYKDASKFANETLAQSSSESEQLTAKKTSTKRKKKNKQIDCSSGPSSDENLSDNELPPFPKFKKNDSKETESSIDVSHNIECSLNDDLNVVSNENQSIFVIDDEDNKNIDLSDGFRCIISNNQNCVSSDESFTVIDNNDIGVSNGSDNLPSVSNKNQNYNFPEDTVNNQTAVTMQEINLSDIDFGSLVSVPQNKQKTHNSSASNLLVEIPPEVNKEKAIINSSLSTTNNCSDSEFQRQLMRQLVTLNARSEEHTKYLDVIMVMVNDLKEKLQHTNPLETSINGRHEVENVLSKFPVTDEIALNEITNDLNNNSSVYDQIVKTLALIGGSSFKESVRRILRKLITDDYAKSFSYTGHKNNKQPFNKTILASLLTRAVHSSNNNSGRTIKEIESVASIWLTKAGERANKTAVVLNNVNID